MNIVLLLLLHQIGKANGCQFKEEIFGNGSENNPAYSKVFQHVSRLVLSSSMVQMIVITDNTTDNEYDFITNISETKSVSALFTTVHSFIDLIRQIMERVLRKQNTEDYWKNLNFLVIATSININEVIEIVLHLDTELGRGCLLRHFSRWILIPTDTDVQMINSSDIVFDHINLITKTNCSPDAFNLTGSVADEDVSVLSLFWEQNGRIWKSNRDFGTQPQSAFPNTRYGLNGRTIDVASREWIPYSKREVVRGEVIFTGVCGEILNRLAVVFNFSIRYVEPQDNQWGDKVNSTWTGIVGMLQRQEVDMCGVPYSMNIERDKVMTYSYPFMYQYQSAVYKTAVNEEKYWGVLTSCFKREVYLCGVIMIIAVCILFSVFEKTNPSGSQSLSLPEIAMFGVMVPLRQGNNALPASTPSKVLLSSWWMFCIVLTTVYTGNLVGIITVAREYTPFRTLEEVANQAEYEVGASSGDYVELALKTSNNSLLQSIWRMVQHSKTSQSTSSQEDWQYHMNKLDGGRYVFLLDRTTIDVLMAERCDISKLNDDFMPIYLSFTFPKLSPLSSLFSEELIHLKENGLVSTWYKMLAPKAKLCMNKSQKEKLRLTAKDLMSGFVACAVGLFIGVVSLLGEMLIRRSLHTKDVCEPRTRLTRRCYNINV